MRAWTLLLVAYALLSRQAEGKRFDHSLVDPLMRRSPLDKNFMRFGRSSPSFNSPDELENLHDPSSEADASKAGELLRSIRGRDNFIRFGRSRNDNFMRFGRGKQDNFMRFGRSNAIDFNDNGLLSIKGLDNTFPRVLRKHDSFMRFGRGKKNDIRGQMRFGRGKPDHFMRLGRSKSDNFMRFGKGKQDNYMRFGRGKQENFMRLGRDMESFNLPPLGAGLDSNDIILGSRGKQDNFMRSGRYLLEDSDDSIPIDNPEDGKNFERLMRARPENFIRFGKSDYDKKFPEKPEDLKNNPSLRDDLTAPLHNSFTRVTKSEDGNLVRLGRHPPTKDDSFMRFGRSSQDSPENELIPQRLKRSVVDFYENQEDVSRSKSKEAPGDGIVVPFSSLADYLDEVFSSSEQVDDYNNRRKRSLNLKSPTSAPVSDKSYSVEHVSANLLVEPQSNLEYQSSLISAGLPNAIVGPEFSLLPDLDLPSSLLKRSRPSDQSFLRLG